MKKLLFSLAALLLASAAFSLSAQEIDPETKAAADELSELATAAAEPEKEIKKGWSFGVLPTATLSADNGFQAGAFGDVYYYGDGKTYPDPLHKISWEASYFTKSHRMRFYLAYDSKYLIPGMRINASLTYMTDPLYSFWGFNGPAAVQDYALWTNRNFVTNDGYNLNYYGISRNMFRALANVQGRITDHLNWAAGVNFWNWTMGTMKDTGVAPKGQSEKLYYNTENTQFNKYRELGLIRDNEANGGNALEINAGFVFDTRDIEAAPNNGIWAEAYLNGNVLSSPYLKACVYFRQYIDIPIHIPAGDPVFAYRLAWQQTIAGETPFYMIQNVPLLVQRNMISEGFGSSNTIRGLRENRILAEGLAWANTELRVKLVNFKLFNQFFYIAVNPFFDAGIITKPYRADEVLAITNSGKLRDDYLTTLNFSEYGKNLTDKLYRKNFQEIHNYRYDGTIYDNSRIHDLIYSAGAGLKIAMNQNFIVSVEFAQCFTPGLDAGFNMGIGINYQF